MQKSIFILLFCAISSTLFAQTNRENEVVLAKRIQNIKLEMSAIETLLLASAEDTTKFTGSLIDSIYVAQRILEDLSYTIYERTDFPVMDVIADESMQIAYDSNGVEMPPMEAPVEEYPSYPPPPPSKGGNPLAKYMQSKSPRTILRLGLSVGLTDMADLSKRQTGANYPRFDFAKSYYRSYQLILETRLGKRDSLSNFFTSFNPKKPWKRQDQFKENKVSLRFGITHDRYRVKELGSNEIITGTNQQATFSPLAFNAKDNDIYVSYLTFPVLMQFKIGKKAVAQGGVFGAIRTSSKQIVVYSQDDFDYERIKIDEFALNKFNYGVQASVGFDGLQLTGKFFLNPLFKDNDVYDFRLFSYGLTFSL
jgi:Outer membrane protein beta-barrel domain